MLFLSFVWLLEGERAKLANQNHLRQRTLGLGLKYTGAGETAHWVMGTAAKHSVLSSIPETWMVKRERVPTSCPLAL